VVKIKRLETVEHRPDHFARGGSDAAMHDGDLVLQRGLLRELRVKLHVRLRIVIDQFDLASKQAAGRIGLLNGQCQRVNHWLAVDIKATREVVYACYPD